MTTLLCFKVHKNDFNVDGDLNDKIYGKSITWLDFENNSYNLSSLLNNQCKFNLLNVINIKESYCNDENSTLNIYQSYNGEGYQINLNGMQKTLSCAKFSASYRDFLDVLSKDQDMFNGEVKNVYAIVLLIDNIYYGHIYCWIHKHEVYCIGIRGRIDSVFLKATNFDYPKQISHYLIEGVRRFAISNNIDIINVLGPLPIMVRIVNKLAFKTRYSYGESNFYPEGTRHTIIYYKDDLSNPFVNNVYNFLKFD